MKKAFTGLPTHQLLAHTLKKRLTEVAGEKLQAVIIYGSRVWGHPDPDSDLDVAAIVRDCTPQLEGALLEAAYQVMWDHDFTRPEGVWAKTVKLMGTDRDRIFQEIKELFETPVSYQTMA